MKTGNLIPAAVLLFASSASYAGIELGVKAGTMQIGFDDVSVTSPPNSVGITLGYRFGSSGLGVEAEATRSITTGTVVDTDLEVESQGLYLSYSTAGRVYLSGRIGLMDAGLVADSLSEDEGGETYGVAVGFRLGKRLRLELDYTAIDDDVNFFNLGLRF